MDKETVIKGLKHIQGLTSIQCLTFPKERIEFHKLIAEVLILLKEQGPIEPINSYGTFRCGNCGHIVGYNDGEGCGYQNNFCGQCGKAVKWDNAIRILEEKEYGNK